MSLLLFRINFALVVLLNSGEGLALRNSFALIDRVVLLFVTMLGFLNLGEILGWSPSFAVVGLFTAVVGSPLS